MNARFFLRTSHYELITPLWNMGLYILLFYIVIIGVFLFEICLIGSCDKKYHFQLKSRKDKGSYLLTLVSVIQSRFKYLM